MTQWIAAVLNLQQYNKILILGNGASGKTTLALRFKSTHAILHLDEHYWKNSTYEHQDKSQFLEVVNQFMQSHSKWVIEGTPSLGLAERAIAADVIYCLQTPRWRCLARWIIRSVTNAVCQRSANKKHGCPARLDLKTGRWIFRYPATQLKNLSKIHDLGQDAKLMF